MVVATRRSSRGSGAAATPPQHSGLRAWTGLPIVALSAAAAYTLTDRADPLSAAVRTCGANAFLCLAASWLTKEHSWTDRLWSVTPLLHVLQFAASSSWAPRLVLLSALVGAWALRLSFNFARKLGYCVGEEDYRWAELQRLLKRRVGDAALFSFLWQTFNVLFIAAYQNALLMAITLPCLASLEPNALPLGRLDVLAALLFMLSFALETIADEQQWAFQSAKHGQDERSAAARRSSAVAADCRRGFLTRGCFSWSRHPNFFAEQMIWWSVALFGSAARGGAVRATDVAGAALLSLLFQGSTTFTEQISAAKYPAYAEYQRRVSRLLPLPPRLSRA